MGRIHYHHGITLFSYIFAVADNGAFPLCESEKICEWGKKKNSTRAYIGSLLSAYVPMSVCRNKSVQLWTQHHVDIYEMDPIVFVPALHMGSLKHLSLITPVTSRSICSLKAALFVCTGFTGETAPKVGNTKLQRRALR